MNIKKKLSICADDFGMTEKISDAIFKLIDAERVTETSCIVLSGAFHNRAKKLSKYQNRIGIGLHLTLTDFVPLSNLKSLSVGGKLGNIKSLLIKSINKNYSKNEIIEEINMQLDLFQKLLGFSPDFIDGHHHVHQLPIIREALIEIIKKRYSDRLPWIRNTSEDMFKIYKRC